MSTMLTQDECLDAAVRQEEGPVQGGDKLSTCLVTRSDSAAPGEGEHFGVAAGVVRESGLLGQLQLSPSGTLSSVARRVGQDHPSQPPTHGQPVNYASRSAPPPGRRQQTTAIKTKSQDRYTSLGHNDPATTVGTWEGSRGRVFFQVLAEGARGGLSDRNEQVSQGRAERPPTADVSAEYTPDVTFCSGFFFVCFLMKVAIWMQRRLESFGEPLCADQPAVNVKCSTPLGDTLKPWSLCEYILQKTVYRRCLRPSWYDGCIGHTDTVCGHARSMYEANMLRRCMLRRVRK
ncbi:hypothetical protein HPB47_016740 [Ixodes persulcatus]|uniref:Uncharacterized protein n=1 Tax=Ixodes persulcatus TaxID=34615 RepID=A0AC60QQ72_IXOPE|nr:hypothetical protein HPB47_016740 [Ixodes persulcatus]